MRIGSAWQCLSMRQQLPVPRRCSRTPLRTFCSYKWLTASNYKEELGRGRKHLGTSTVTLNWEHEKREEEFLQLCTFFAQSSAFENVTRVILDAPHLPLDGRFIEVLSEGKPLLKELEIKAWTFHSAKADMWAGFQQLHSLQVDLSDGRYFPDCFNDLLTGLPSLTNVLDIKNRGPHYGALDCALVPRGVSVYFLRGLTLQNWAGLLDERPCERDCKRGLP